jgi:hypothetical protein
MKLVEEVTKTVTTYKALDGKEYTDKGLAEQASVIHSLLGCATMHEGNAILKPGSFIKQLRDNPEIFEWIVEQVQPVTDSEGHIFVTLAKMVNERQTNDGWFGIDKMLAREGYKLIKVAPKLT